MVSKSAILTFLLYISIAANELLIALAASFGLHNQQVKHHIKHRSSLNHNHRPLPSSSASLLSSKTFDYDDPLVVQTQKGYVRGIKLQTITGRSVDAFLGIRYAKPPVGKYRFRHPKPLDPWEGIFDATSYSSACYQLNDTFLGDFKGAKMWNPNVPLDEDCLSLNIWVPSSPRPSNSAVLVWIYGGGFATGTSSLEVYNGSILAGEENIIVVSINYRVASLGFIYLGLEDAPGNAGLFDQLMAIEWIRDNIAFFGGNPSNITLFGESAGAASVAFHLLSPLSRNLFSQAILQSGSSTCPWAIVDRKVAFKRSLKLAKDVGCEVSSLLTSFISSSSFSSDNPLISSNLDRIIECLQSIPPMELINKEEEVYGVVEFPFVPIVDGSFLDENPAISLQSKNFKRASVMAGSNRDEGTYFLVYNWPRLFNLSENVYVSKSDFENYARSLHSEKPGIAQDAIIHEYTNWLNPEDPVVNRDSVDKLVGDYHFTCPVNELTYRYALHGNDVWAYYFAHRSSRSPWPSWMGVIHGDEIKFILGEPLDPVHGYRPEEVELSRQMMRYWANFARTGNPNKRYPNGEYTEKIVWPEHTAHEREFLVLSSNDSSIGKGPRVKQCAFWKQFLPKLIQFNDKRHNSACSNISSSQHLQSISRLVVLLIVALTLTVIPLP